MKLFHKLSLVLLFVTSLNVAAQTSQDRKSDSHRRKNIIDVLVKKITSEE